MLKKLRRIAFASMFVLDVCGPRLPFGEGEDEDEDEPNGHHDPASMDLDDEGDEVYETRGEADPISDMQETLARNLGHLAVWADKFLDDHLRMPHPLGEIWFIDNRFAGNIAAGYDQVVMMGDDGRVEHIINHHPPGTRKRDGWWWNESDPIPLD